MHDNNDLQNFIIIIIMLPVCMIKAS